MSNRQAVFAVAVLIASVGPASEGAPRGRTVVSIHGEQFFINGRPTYEGRTWNGARIEGLLLNSRMVQGIFDDLNPETVANWAYPDTGRWDIVGPAPAYVDTLVSTKDGVLGVKVDWPARLKDRTSRRW